MTDIRTRPKQRFSRKKFERVLLYVLAKFGSDGCEETKLMNIIGMSDFINYQHTGRSITGETWLHAPSGYWPKHWGPIPG